MSSRRLARRDAIAPLKVADADPNRVLQREFIAPSHGPVRVWLRGGAVTRLRVAGETITRHWDAAALRGWLTDPEIRAGLK